MNEELQELREHIKRLRADLSATNTLLLAIYEAIPVAYQEKVLPVLAAKMAEREQLAGKVVPPEATAAMERVETAVERLWDEAQAAHRRSVAALKKPQAD